MTKKFLEKVKRTGLVDTRKYRYVYYKSNTHESIERIPLEWLDTVKALGAWEIVCHNEV